MQLHCQQRDFLSTCTYPCLQKNIYQNVRLENPNANRLHSLHHNTRRDSQIMSLNVTLKVENYYTVFHFLTDQFSIIVVFLKSCKFVIKLQDVSISSLE